MKLLPRAQHQLPYLRYWQCDDDDVEHDVERCGRPTERVHVDALALVLLVPTLPGEIHRLALEGDGDHEGDGVGGAAEDDEVDDDAEAPVGEDAEVETADRDLDQRKGRDVERLVEEVDL